MKETGQAFLDAFNDTKRRWMRLKMDGFVLSISFAYPSKWSKRKH